ncbi:terminase large subunit [Sphingomonas immobilis]|uniref:Terminase large subunit n=1 Tax=Sphingomonas immobilis TaxID=3063997 RepID=A0ABT8ZU45_9SPHN|nr:terminase TerL endonuclease subunit [Sphingomonas sp. CA1-15]MDO7841089.1 terminase large subunit [Sphingomonas sp. CA1-15]
MAARSRETRSRATDTGHARDYAAIALAYAKRAASDKKQVSHCKWVRLAAQRHIDDLKRSRSAAWGWKFDPWHANDICDFMEKLPHVEGVWDKPTIVLEPAQIFVLAVVFGWRVKKTGLRRFTVVYEEVARKNAKSTKTAGISLYCLACENETGPQVLTAATTFDQAKKVFHPAKRMVEKMPALQEAFGIIPWAKSITCADNGGYMQPLHAKSKTQDGHNPHLATMDELHAHADRGLYDVMRSAFGARKQPLLWQITTAGSNTHGVCYEQRTMATKVLERSVIAEHLFGIIFTLDGPKDFEPERKVGDDPYDERNWIKANPLLGAAVQLDELRQYAIEAKNSPSAEGEFKTKRLNLWIGAATAWLNVSQWIACADPSLRLSDFRGLDCYIGADLADKDDITAVTLAAVDGTGRLLVKTWFFLPEAALARDDPASKQIVELYRQWKNGRHLWTTKGDFVDHNRVERLIRRLITALVVKRVTFDQFAAAQAMASRLNEDFANGDEPFASILAKNANNVADPAKDLEARVKAGAHQLRHDGNPVMTWMAGNAVVDRRVNGSIMPKKETPMSANKIDGIDATVNAIAPMQLPPADDGSLDDFIARMKNAA